MGEPRHYVIQILPNFRSIVNLHLKQLGLSAFYPQVVDLDIYSRQENVEYLYSNYGFVEFDIEKDDWASIRYARGVVGLLPVQTTNRKNYKSAVYALPKPMPAGFVERLKLQNPIDWETLIKILNEYGSDMAHLQQKLREIEKGDEIIGEKGTYIEDKRGVVLEVRGRFLEILLSWTASVDRIISVSRRDVRQVAPE
jgi:transcription antitermination factor NusG